MNTERSACALRLFVAILSLLTSCEKIPYYHEDGSDITSAEAVEIVRPLLRKFYEEGIIRVWKISKDPIPARATLKYGPFGNYDPTSKSCGTVNSPNFKSWLVMIGPNININGSSDKNLCIFVNVKTGDYTELSMNGEITGIEWDTSYINVGEVPPFNPYSTIASTPKLTRSSSSLSSTASGLYAVIISGGINPASNFSRYWKDCQYIYQRLTQTLDYNESHIYCLVADGTDPAADMAYAFNPWTYTFYCQSSPLDFDNDGDNDILYSATKANISTVFNLLQSQAASIDHLLVFVTDHGTPDGKICLWGNSQELSPADFYTELNKLPGVRMDIVLGQCYSGAFIPLCGSSNRTFSTACSATEESRGLDFSYDYFLHAWTDAFDPTNASTVDTNTDNMISLKEAFEYAVAHDEAAIQDEEHPQYDSTPLIYGYTHDLTGLDNRPIINGSDYLSCNFNSSYTITGLPSGTSVTWSNAGNMTLTSPTNTSVQAKGALSNPSAYVATNSGILAHFTLEGTQYFVNKEIQSIWKPGVYYGPYIFGTSGEYVVDNGPGASGYHWFSDNNAWTIMSQGSSQVYVSEGPTSSPVTLTVSFQDPWGNPLVVSRQFNTY